MASIPRRRFVQHLAAAALYRRPLRLLDGSQRIFGPHEGNTVPLDVAAIRKLASDIAGHVITPEAPDYESSRLVFNRAFNKRPALIVRCAGASDVARALDFTRTQGLPLAVRGGGHSHAGYGVCDRGVVIDLSGMALVKVDANKRVARAEAGSLVRDLDQATQRFGLATPSGGCSTVGIAGLTLGGGEAHLMPKYGAPCHNLLSAHVITVDGRQLMASPESNPDLFWAIRGGGGNFGVVTSFEYRLHPVTEVLAGTLLYPTGQLAETLHTYIKFMTSAPDEMMVLGEVLPSDQGPKFRMQVCFCGRPSLGNDLLQPLRGPLKPQEDKVTAMSYLEHQANGMPATPIAGFQTSLFLPELSEPTVAAILSATHDAPQQFRVLIVPFHGAVTRVRSSAMAFALRQRGYEVQLACRWSDSAESPRAVRWVNALRESLKPFAHGVYVNGLGETSDDLVKAAYGANYDRLVKIKQKYDPTNLLRLNQNVRPQQTD